MRLMKLNFLVLHGVCVICWMEDGMEFCDTGWPYVVLDKVV